MLDERTEVCFNREVAEDFYLLQLQAPSIAAAARPGQFVEVRVSRRISPFLRVPLSVCQIDADSGTIDVLYEDMGPKTHALSQAKAGDVLDCIGPLGQGFRAPLAGTRPVLVGGGIGVPPLVFLGARLRAGGADPVLVVGARSAAKHLPDDLLGPAAATLLRATDDGSLAHQGLVTDLLAPLLAEGGVEVFTCGPHGMMAAVAGLCRQAQVPCQASLEEYMACGFGVCVGCVVEIEPAEGQEQSPYERYRRICLDGPVFDAHRVNWGD